MQLPAGRLFVPKTNASAEAAAASPRDAYAIVRVEEEAVWEAQLLLHPRRNIFCAWGWGDYKARQGWRVERLLITGKSGATIGMAQVQTRTVAGRRFHYMHGCPLFFADDDTVVERGLAAVIEHLKPRRLDLVAVRYEQFERPVEVIALLANGFDPVLNQANHTTIVDLADGIKVARGRLRRNRAQQLRKALANPDLSTHIVTGHDERSATLDAFAGMYSALAVRKGFTQAIDVKAFRETLLDDPRFVVLEVRDGERIAAVRIAHVAADRLTDLFAASDEGALGNGVNTLAVWRLIEHTAESGLRFYDGCGINARGNAGVVRFKRGLGGDIVQSGPLWLFGRTRLLQIAVGAYLAFR